MGDRGILVFNPRHFNPEITTGSYWVQCEGFKIPAQFVRRSDGTLSIANTAAMHWLVHGSAPAWIKLNTPTVSIQAVIAATGTCPLVKVARSLRPTGDLTRIRDALRSISAPIPAEWE